MQVINELILDTTEGILDSGWVNVASVAGNFSLGVTGLEKGAALKVHISNEFMPVAADLGVSHASVTGDSQGNTISQPSVISNWVRLIKTGGSSQPTQVRLFGVAR
jgi:hypothetical protein